MDKKEINLVLKKSEKAFKIYRDISNANRAKFLRVIATEIETLGDALLNTASRETNLPITRLTGERGRTLLQLRLFADLIENGAYAEPIIEKNLRKMLIPLGTVAVFGSSNFPFAYSTAGGDTASALAVGCPVIVKGHPAHIETSRMVADAILKAAAQTKMPDGVFAHIEGDIDVGEYLVKHPVVKAVGFTGSFQGGKALFDLANRRKVPIPVFAEMGSINPVFLFENALIKDAEKIATLLADSITLGVGQFCTNPGLIIGIESSRLTNFITLLKNKLKAKMSGAMLHQGIADSYKKGIEKMFSEKNVELSIFNNDEIPINGFPVLGVVDGSEFLKNKTLHQEVFGPFTLVVICKNKNERDRIIENLEGQLTASLFAEPSDLKNQQKLIQAISQICGRINLNNVPTGVEVTHAMQHGGPFPASTDSRYGAVGQSAVLRWLRPICYQNFSEELLPEALKK